MIRYSKDRIEAVTEKKAGGEGFMTSRSIISDKSEIADKGRLFSELILLPGHSIGYHQHNGETELFCITRGKAEYNDNGTIAEISAGDVTICKDGESHGIKNIGDEPLVFTALILYI